MPFLVQLSRRTGQKEARYAHLLSGQPVIPEEETHDEQFTTGNNALETRVTKLEQELADLKMAFDKLMKELN